MLLREIADTSRRVTEIRARLAKIAALSECLRHLPPEELEVGVALLAGELRQGRIGIGYATLRKLGRDRAAARSELTLAEVDRAFEAIAGLRGPGSAGERDRILAELLRRGTPDEQDFLRRVVLGEVRQGALEGLVVEAVARAAGVPAEAVRRALMLTGDMAQVARAALERGETGLAAFRIELFRPVQPMLARTAEDAGDALSRLGQAALEFKLDGARVQVHRAGSDVRVFTRKLNDVTAAAPELVEAALALPARSLILDGEAVAVRSDGRPQPFQTTMRRFGRKLDVQRLRGELPLRPFFFDCLHLDGEDLIDRRADERCDALSATLEPGLRVPRRAVRDVAEADAFLAEALRCGHEGVMVKSLDAPYEAGRRGASWLKVKPAHTLDLVVLAVEWGSGRRKGWLSNLHLGARDPARGGFAMLGKTFKGMTDEMLEWQTRRFQELEIGRDAHTVYVRPEQVVEIAFDGVQASPHYPAGLALRFARVKRYRPDKRPEDADELDTVRAIHARTAGA
jgi:DNA ligase-1